jgi:hypothetical protein
MNHHKDECNEDVAVELDTTLDSNTGGGSESDPRDQTTGDPQDQAGGEKSRKGPYALHGVFSKSPWKILAKGGEDMKKLAATERMLYEHYRPTDAYQEFVLDRAWASVLRCVISGREEERIFATSGKPGAERIKDMGALASYGGAKAIAELTSAGLLNELGNLLRYDAYYAKEFIRWIGFLEELQHGGGGGYVFGPPRKGGSGKTDDN